MQYPRHTPDNHYKSFGREEADQLHRPGQTGTGRGLSQPWKPPRQSGQVGASWELPTGQCGQHVTLVGAPGRGRGLGRGRGQGCRQWEAAGGSLGLGRQAADGGAVQEGLTEKIHHEGDRPPPGRAVRKPDRIQGEETAV